MADDNSDQTKDLYGKLTTYPDQIVVQSSALNLVMIERLGSKLNEWKINRGDPGYVTASVSDSEFLKKLEDGTEEIARGEYLVVLMQKTQTLTSQGKLSVVFDIKKVIKHGLFSNDGNSAPKK